MKDNTKLLTRYNYRELKMLQNGYMYDKHCNLVKNPNIKTPVRVLNPFTGRMMLLTSLYNSQDYRDEKIIYHVDTNTLEVVDEELKKQLKDHAKEKHQEKQKLQDKVEAVRQVFGYGYDYDSDSDYDSDYEDCYDGFTWDEEGNIYLDF